MEAGTNKIKRSRKIKCLLTSLMVPATIKIKITREIIHWIVGGKILIKLL